MDDIEDWKKNTYKKKLKELEEKIKNTEEIEDLKIREEKYKEYLYEKTHLVKLRISLLNNEEREKGKIRSQINIFEKKLKKNFKYLEKIDNN